MARILMNSPRPDILRFGTFELDVRSGELRKNGVRVHLQEKPLQVLLALVERPGDLITRDEIRERLWSETFVDFDHSLGTAIAKLRSALGDSARSPRFIETVGGRGYRFIAPVADGDSADLAGRQDVVMATIRTSVEAQSKALSDAAAEILAQPKVAERRYVPLSAADAVLRYAADFIPSWAGAIAIDRAPGTPRA
jgi:DNA-binding winged helix-turn-helix (wHTH) protein